MTCSRANSTFTPRCLKTLPPVRRTDSVRKNPQQIVGFYMIMGPEQWDGLRHEPCKDPISASGQDKTYLWQSVYSDKYVFSVSEGTGSTSSLCDRSRISPCTNLYDDHVFPRLHSLDNKLWTVDLSRCGRKKIIQEGTLK